MGRSWGPRHKQDSADKDETHSVRQINPFKQYTIQTWLAPQPDPLSLETHSAGSHETFTLPLLGLLPRALRVWGPWVYVCLSVRMCSGHKRRWPHMTWKQTCQCQREDQQCCSWPFTVIFLLNYLQHIRTHTHTHTHHLIKSFSFSVNLWLRERNVLLSRGQVTTTMWQ